MLISSFLSPNSLGDRTPNAKAQNFIQILIISVTIVVVAVPEGELLPIDAILWPSLMIV